jgi:phosphatidylethanolamine/phosphatidyl-N-methylethanolamine N-methyltransferase
MIYNQMKKVSLFAGILMCCFLPAMANIREVGMFWRGAIKNPKAVGAVMPCSSTVGEELVRYMTLQQRREPSKPLHILEGGAGTGSMTEIIVKYLRPIDHLDLVEISPEFCRVLQEKFGNRSNVTIHCKSILDFVPDYPCDIIISTLPFMSLDCSLIKNVLAHYKKLIIPGGFLSYVGYAGIPVVKKTLLWGKRKREHCEKLRVLDELRSQYQIDQKTILGNCPPITIYHCCITK